MIDVDRDRLWGDGLAASFPGGLCRKFRREDSQKARVEQKRAAVEHREVQHRFIGFVGFRSSATRLSVYPGPCSCGAHCGKVVPLSCKVTGRLPIERKPVDNVPQKNGSPPHSLLSSTARFSELVPMINEILIPRQKTIETGQKQKILFKPTIWFHFFPMTFRDNCVPLPQMENQRRKKEIFCFCPVSIVFCRGIRISLIIIFTGEDYEKLSLSRCLHLLCPETLTTRTPVCPVVCEPKNE